jgi:spore germination protein YaaH
VFKSILISIFGLIIGICCGYFIVIRIFHGSFSVPTENIISEINILNKKPEIIGFLPYWLVNDANKRYSKNITTLTYFGLTVAENGTIQKFLNPAEEEPGWYTLHSGKIDELLSMSKKNNIKTSLLIFSGNEDVIGQLIDNPREHAQNLMRDVSPIMKQYGFSDLNLDIESVSLASDSARQNFTSFVDEVKSQMQKQNLGTLSIEASPTVLIKKYLINLNEISPLVDNVVLMMYDFHYPGSSVTGPVSPVNGAGVESEFDSEVGIKQALKIVPLRKIILGIPLYGYEWETLDATPRSATIPATGIAASNRRVEELLKTCDTCTVGKDETAKESYVTYKDDETGTFHQIFYPDAYATRQKIDLAHKYHIRGLALWALGYEGDSILDPLERYKNSSQ